MSKVVKGAAKVFRKVVKVAVKVAPYVVLAGAVVFSAGAALGVAGMAGGWSAAAASVGTALGGTGTLGTILTGAVYQAGIGAAVGGGLAAVTGQDIGKGIAGGAAVGAITGGATGLLSPSSVNMTTLSQANAPAAGTVGSGAGTITSEALPAAAPNPANAVAGATDTAAATVTAPTTASTAANAATGAAETGISGWMNRNPVLASGAMNAAGTGLLAVSQGDDNSAEQSADEKRENYGPASGYTGLLRRDSMAPDTTVRPTTQERFNTSYEYQWDPTQRRLVKVATAA